MEFRSTRAAGTNPETGIQRGRTCVDLDGASRADPLPNINLIHALSGVREEIVARGHAAPFVETIVIHVRGCEVDLVELLAG